MKNPFYRPFVVPRHQVTPASRAQVAAAMVAAVAERGADHVDHSGHLMTPDGAQCIQGAMLSKLGHVFESDLVAGTTVHVMERIGQAPIGSAVCPCGTCACKKAGQATSGGMFADPLLYEALHAAQKANDLTLTWGVALTAFEAVLAGKPAAEVRAGLTAQANERASAMEKAAFSLAKEMQTMNSQVMAAAASMKSWTTLSAAMFAEPAYKAIVWVDEFQWVGDDEKELQSA